MKLLCLCYRPADYQREIPYILPMQRIATLDADGASRYFRPYGITLDLKIASSHAEMDAALAGDYDVLVLHEKPLYEPAIDCGKPVIFLERLDGAQLRNSREYLPRICGVIKGYVFRDRQQYNAIPDRAHIKVLSEHGLTGRKPLYGAEPAAPRIEQADLIKLRAGYGFGAWNNATTPARMDVDLDAPRSIDVHFAGTVDYQHTEVEAHRRRALWVAEQWPYNSIASPGRQISTGEYHQQLLASKTVLCPWGWGEATHREYEAWLLGAVVIKPDTDYVEGWPDMYQSGYTYVACRPDFSDAHEKIDHVRRHWDDYRPMRERARRLVAESHKAEHVAKRMSLLIEDLVG